MPRGLEEEMEEPAEKPYVETDAKEVRWTVPDGTNKVTLFKYDAKGNYVSQYNISSYIAMNPGETFIIKVK